jgi:hypothetical protein
MVQEKKDNSTIGPTSSSIYTRDAHPDHQSSNTKPEQVNESARKRKDHSDELETLSTSSKPRIRRIRKTTTLEIAPAPVSPSELYVPRNLIETERNNNVPHDNFVAEHSNPGSPLLYAELTSTKNYLPKEFDTVDNESPPLLSHREMSVQQQQELQMGRTQDEALDADKPVEYPKTTVSTVDNKASTQTSHTSANSHHSIVNSETSEEEKYFTSRLHKMWSPKQSEIVATAFRQHPPDVNSPTQVKSEIQRTQPNIFELYDIANDNQSETDDAQHLVSGEVIYRQPPPSLDSKHHIDVVYKEPYYSDRRDAPRRPKIYAGKEFKLKTLEPSNLEEFLITGSDIIDLNPSKAVRATAKIGHITSSTTSWTPSTLPPTFRDASKWLEREAFHIHEEDKKRKHNTQGGDRINASSDSSNTPTKKKQIYTQVSLDMPCRTSVFHS